MPFKDPAARQRYNKMYGQTRDRSQKTAQQRASYWAGKTTGTTQQSMLTRPFVGCDGEGFTNAVGYHCYNMLRIGDELLKPKAGHSRLQTVDMLEFIVNQPPDNIYVGYFFEYDVTKILEDIGFGKMSRLVHREERKRKDGKGWWPLDFADYQLDYFPKKEFKVRKWTGEHKIMEDGYEAKVYTPWVTIHDVGTFFQCSFVKALEQWGITTPEERQRIAETKILRGSFTEDEFDTIADYNQRECIYLAQLMEKFRDVCADIGVIPRKWQGPGQLVEALMRKHAVPQSKDVKMLTDPAFAEVRQMAQYSYYGGRFETSRVGDVTSPIYQYDINSAYPHAMLSVPCLEHGHWTKEVYEQLETTVYSHPLALAFGSFEDKAPSHFYGLPMRRSDGSIYFPAKGSGWYWSFEIQASVHQNFVPDTVWYYETYCDCKPLGFLEDMYQERLKVGKTDKGNALKLMMNSTYGKMAQSIGMPKYSNPFWASYITAHCRTKLQRFLHSQPACKKGMCGHDVVMFATDSVASLVERKNIKPSKVLGGWDLEVHPDGMFIVQGGMYFGSSGKGAKTRGVSGRVMGTTEYRRRFESAFRVLLKNGRFAESKVQVPVQIFCGMRLALAHRNTKRSGQWYDDYKSIGFNWHSKRDPVPQIGLSGTYVRTRPITGSTNDVTVGYSRDIGGLAQYDERDMVEEGQPDWAPFWQHDGEW